MSPECVPSCVVLECGLAVQLQRGKRAGVTYAGADKCTVEIALPRNGCELPQKASTVLDYRILAWFGGQLPGLQD